MFLLDWRLAAVLARAAAGLRLADAPRGRRAPARSPPSASARWPTSPALVQESLSVSGILLGKTMGRSAELADRFEGESAHARRPRGPLAHGRPLGDGLDPDDLRRHAGARLPVRRPGSPGPTRSRSAPSSRSPRCRRGCSSRSGRCSAWAVDIQTSIALFDRVFEYLDLPVDIDEHGDRATLARDRCAARSRFEDVWFRYDADEPVDAARRSTSRCPPAPRTAIVGETGSGKTTLGYLVARLYDAGAGPGRASTASTCAT